MIIKDNQKKYFSVCITGHRRIEEDIDESIVEHYLNALIIRNFDTFYVGMALGFDTMCFQILERLRKKKNIKIIACVPCLSQPERFSYSQKKEYYRMLESADEKIILKEQYTSTCMQERNEFMVDNSALVFAYLNRNYGGTANTVKYARKKGLPIINIASI